MVYFGPCFLQCINATLFNFAPFENTLINDNERYRYQLILHICGESALLIVYASSHNTIYLLSKAETN